MDHRLTNDLLKLAEKYFELGLEVLSRNNSKSDKHKDPPQHPEDAAKSELIKHEVEGKRPREKKKSKKDAKRQDKITSYRVFYDEKLDELRQQNEKINIQLLSKTASKEWASFDEETKSNYREKANKINLCKEALKEATITNKSASEMSDTESDDSNDQRKKAKIVS